MKKQFYLLFAILVAFSSLFVSCEEQSYGIPCEINISAEEGGCVEFKDYFGFSMNVYTGSDVTVFAKPDDGFYFVGWYVENSVSPVSTEETYKFTVRGDLSLVAKFEKSHEYVDLGLSVKWATCNVGASSPEDYGGYYAWGETEEKSIYNWSTYKWRRGDDDNLTKYCTYSSYGTVDNKTVLDLEDDVAHVKWGGSWRMPTLAEQEELLSNCTWTWTTLNGVKGYKVTGPNGNSIFLPAAGSNYGTGLDYSGSHGFYWSSSLYASGCYDACFLRFTSGFCGWDAYYRCNGRSVRPVSK